MRSPFRELVEVQILDRAAALFARRGFDKTSVQDVADAVGLSKTGLLHHYPSKDALHAAVRSYARTLGDEVLEHVASLPRGPARDRRAVEALVDVALRHPGTVALMLAPASELGGPDAEQQVDEAASAVLQAFGVVIGEDGALASTDGSDPERVVRVIGAMGALAVLTLAAHRRGGTTTWRPLVVATCLDALGHRPETTRRSTSHARKA